MSAHCDNCGADLVFRTGEDWQLMTCPRCEADKRSGALEKALRECIAAAGMPDAADGCRAIIRIATGALEIPDLHTSGDDFGA